MKNYSEIVRESQPPRIPNIFVAVPSSRDWKTEFGSSMICLSSHLSFKVQRGEIDGFNIRCRGSSLLPAGRQSLLDEALASDSTHILWIDDDTKFPSEVVDCFLSRNVDYIAANMLRKTIEFCPTAQDVDGNLIDSTYKTGIEEVSWVGLGLCMINLDSIRKIPSPHFEVVWLKEKNKYLGEDMYLCEKLRQAGIKMYVDHDVSKAVGHIGDYTYQFQTLEYKKEAA